MGDFRSHVSLPEDNVVSPMLLHWGVVTKNHPKERGKPDLLWHIMASRLP